MSNLLEQLKGVVDLFTEEQFLAVAKFVYNLLKTKE